MNENVKKNLENAMKDIWTAVSPMLTIMCVLALSLSALQTLSRIA